jgi:hypothetical protein
MSSLLPLTKPNGNIKHSYRKVLVGFPYVSIHGFCGCESGRLSICISRKDLNNRRIPTEMVVLPSKTKVFRDPPRAVRVMLWHLWTLSTTISWTQGKQWAVVREGELEWDSGKTPTITLWLFNIAMERSTILNR